MVHRVSNVATRSTTENEANKWAVNLKKLYLQMVVRRETTSYGEKKKRGNYMTCYNGKVVKAEQLRKQSLVFRQAKCSGSQITRGQHQKFPKALERGRTYAHFPPRSFASLVWLVSSVLVLLSQLLGLVVADLDRVNAGLSFLEANGTVANVLSYKEAIKPVSSSCQNVAARKTKYTHHPSPSKP